MTSAEQLAACHCREYSYRHIKLIISHVYCIVIIKTEIFTDWFVCFSCEQAMAILEVAVDISQVRTVVQYFTFYQRYLKKKELKNIIVGKYGTHFTFTLCAGQPSLLPLLFLFLSLSVRDECNRTAAASYYYYTDTGQASP